MSDWVTLQRVLDLTLRPIDTWPEKLRYDRERSPYSAPLKDTLATLKKELSALAAKNIVLQIAFREQDFRLDGLPRANAIATHPGVILAFGSKHGSLRLFFDRFTRWEGNLRAIAMHLEHLRLAGLYGVGKDGQQYQGWKALPAPEPGGFQAAADAWEWLCLQSGITGSRANSDLVKQAYRIAAARLHPDSPVGDHESFVKLQSVKRLIDIARDQETGRRSEGGATAGVA